ncbi:MAG: hypothetical protein AB1453_09585 [Chloroflexota bacterium]|jgi:hypothetical protein
MNDPLNSRFFDRIAHEDFEQALRKGFWRSVLGWINKSPNQLLAFDEVRKYLPVQGQHDIGVRQIAIEKIVGSVGRYNDFDRAFLPRHRQTSGRWISIDVAKLKDIELPPIEVYKVGDVFFVKDGNHRVSVAKEKGQKFIDAYITEVVTDLPIDEHTDIDGIIRLQEKSEFFRITRLNEIRPDEEIELSLPGQYPKLLEHINVHRWYMGEKRQAEVPYGEAVAAWYDEVYLPLMKVITEQGICKEFPDRTGADLYIWIIEHLYYLREEFRQEINLEQAARSFKEGFSPNPIRRMFNLFRRLANRLAEGLEDAADLELGILPEDMMIDPEPDNPHQRGDQGDMD